MKKLELSLLKVKMMITKSINCIPMDSLVIKIARYVCF